MEFSLIFKIQQLQTEKVLKPSLDDFSPLPKLQSCESKAQGTKIVEEAGVDDDEAEARSRLGSQGLKFI